MSDDDPMIGRVLSGNIELRRKIGSGGMGNVYEGYQAHLDRLVAVKLMTPEHAANPVAAKYFLREARSASQLRHPNIIQIIDYGKEDDSTLFMAMEFIPGRPLSQVISKEFPLGPDRVVGILDQTLAALAEAHRKQIVHRDLKPDNLMVEEIDGGDFVKVLDFGIAQSRAPEQKAGPLTQQGAVVGTPRYMSPEQAAGDAVDRRSDLFSLGSILYELLTQKPPFAAENIPETLVAVIRHNPQPPSSERPDLSISPALEAVCLRALKKNPDLRYQTAAEFREALNDAQAKSGEAASPAAPAQFIFRRSGERKARAEADDATIADTEISGGLSGTELSWAEESSEAANDRLGLDLDELRGDLLGERVDVVALVTHQRSHRRVDAEAMADLRAGIEHVFDEIAKRYDARLHSRQGSFVTLLFGVGTPAPDDAERAAQAAMKLREALSRFAPDGTAFSFGLAAGEVFCPSSDLAQAAGPPLDDGLEASRTADDGEITIAGPALQNRLAALFELEEAAGDPTGRVIAGLRRDGGDVEPSEPALSDLIGRDTEVAAILGALGDLRRGTGTSLVYVGEPGVGKTALLGELTRLARQRKHIVLTARPRWQGAETIRTIRMQWLVGLVHGQGYALRDATVAFRDLGVAPEYARLLAAFVGGTLEDVLGTQPARDEVDEETRAEVAVRFAMRRLFEAASESHYIVLILDDLNGLEGELAEFVDRWTKITTELPLIFASGVRVRPGEAIDSWPDDARRLTVEPLDQASSRAFVKVRLPEAAPDLVDRIVEIGGGVALHLEHLAHYARAHPDMERRELEEALAQSREVGALLRLRLFEQPKPAQNVIALLAALGNGTNGDVLLDLASDDWNPDQVLQDLHAAGLLEVEGPEERPRLYLRPPALVRTAYDRLSRKMRAKIHGRAARYFDARVRKAGDAADHEDLVALGHHLEAAGKPDEALRVLGRLVDGALREHDYDLARDHLSQTLRLLQDHRPDDLDAAARTELRLLRCDVAVGDRGTAIDRCRKLQRIEGLSPTLDAEIRLEMARLWLQDEDPALVQKIAGRALDDLRAMHAETPGAVEVLGLLIRALQLGARIEEEQGNLVKASELALEAVELTERFELDPADNPWGPALVWETLNQLGRIRIRMGDPGPARKMFDLAKRVVDRTGDARGDVAVRANMATLLATEGDLQSAHDNIEAALRIARRLSDPSAIARLEHNRANILQRQGRDDEARAAFRDSLAIAEDLDWREGIAMNVQRLRALEPEE